MKGVINLILPPGIQRHERGSTENTKITAWIDIRQNKAQEDSLHHVYTHLQFVFEVNSIAPTFGVGNSAYSDGIWMSLWETIGCGSLSAYTPWK
jgi:hypothetical protein